MHRLTPEERHQAQREAQRRYDKTAKGIARHERYNASRKGRARVERYEATIGRFVHKELNRLRSRGAEKRERLAALRMDIER